MALFTDGNLSTIEDLKSYESAILEVANTEGIDLTAKAKLASSEMAAEMAPFLMREGRPVGLEASGVVVTPSLRLWHTVQTLSVVYRDAYFSQLNDRYKAKWSEYRRLAHRIQGLTFDTGIGIVADPVSRAEPPHLRLEAGILPPGTYYVCISWVNTAGSEGSASDVLAIEVANGASLVVGATNPPANASGYHVYAALNAMEPVRQTTDPIAVGAEWVMPGSGVTDGPAPGDGQVPQTYVKTTRTLQRG